MQLQKFGALVKKQLNHPLMTIYLKHYRNAEMDLSAIAVAYYLLLTVFPLLAIIANLLPYLNFDMTTLLTIFEERLPSTMYESLSQLLEGSFTTTTISTLLVAVVTALWTMSKSLASLQKAVNKVYGISKNRGYFLARLVGLLLSLLILFLITFVFLLSTFSTTIVQIISLYSDIGTTLSNLLGDLVLPLFYLMLVVGIGLLYWFLPNVKIKYLRYIIPGTAFTSFVLIFLNDLVNSYILSRVGRFGDIKTISTIIIFAVMLYFIFLARILILGVIFNATYQEYCQGKLEERDIAIEEVLQELPQKPLKIRKNSD